MKEFSNEREALLHLQSVGDNLVLGSSTSKEARSLQRVLHTFLLALGGLVNDVKSEIFFFNTKPIIQINICRIVDSKGAPFHENI
jgi:hypothetical protein